MKEARKFEKKFSKKMGEKQESTNTATEMQLKSESTNTATEMQLKSLFNLATKSGHPLDSVKSAMQKYARRGMATEMLEAVSEIDAFKAFADSDKVTVQRAAKAVRTNMINRLKVILFEDVSFSQIGAYAAVCEKIKEWEDDGRADRNTLAEIVAIIAHAKKLRMPSYLRYNFGTGQECKLNKDDFLELVKDKDISSVEWIYHNEEEALKMLEAREFPGKEYVLPMCKAEWKRLKPTKSKPGSNERFLFVVVPWLWIIFADDLRRDGADAPSFSKKKIAAAYKKCDVKFDDFVYDKHTKDGRKMGKTARDFRAEGAMVCNEDSVWLAPYEELKEKYEGQPEPKKPEPKKRESKKREPAEQKPKRLRRVAAKPDNIKEIDLNVDDIELITEGVCGNKLPCGFATINGRDKVIKPMTKGLNHGMDYCYVDKQKKLFGLKDLGMKMRRIPGKVLTVVRAEDKSRSYEWKDDEEGQVIAVMTKINVKSDLGKLKALLKDESKFREMLKIRLFNGFFRTSDNILRNILVDENDDLWAIDENDIYGKRADVFNKKEPVKNSPFMTAELIESVIDELDFAAHEQTLVDELSKYFAKASCEFYERELRERVRNYKQIVLKELGF